MSSTRIKQRIAITKRNHTIYRIIQITAFPSAFVFGSINGFLFVFALSFLFKGITNIKNRTDYEVAKLYTYFWTGTPAKHRGMINLIHSGTILSIIPLTFMIPLDNKWLNLYVVTIGGLLLLAYIWFSIISWNDFDKYHSRKFRYQFLVNLAYSKGRKVRKLLKK